MDSLLERSRGALAALEKLPSEPELAAVLQDAKTNLELYVQERALIAQAKAGGPEMAELSFLATSANFVFGRWRRHFSGRSRNTRDFGILAEMIDDLTKIEGRMVEVGRRVKNASLLETHARDLDTVRGNLKLYKSERAEIDQARKSGSEEQQASSLAECANAQFQLYRDHFAGRSRLTRRPQLLQRIVQTLETIRREMSALVDKGYAISSHKANIGIVETNLKVYSTELSEIKKARATAKIVDLMGNLGGEANEIMETYAKEFGGQDRRTRNLVQLSVLCDRLGEVGRQMQDLGRAEHDESNVRNLEIVRDNLVLLENEYEAIATLQSDNRAGN